MSRRSWFAVEGSLEPIDYDGPSFFGFPQAVAEHVIERYSAPGDWIIDPFCGFGTTLAVAERPRCGGPASETEVSQDVGGAGDACGRLRLDELVATR